jgi:hypothetical protein
MFLMKNEERVTEIEWTGLSKYLYQNVPIRRVAGEKQGSGT